MTYSSLSTYRRYLTALATIYTLLCCTIGCIENNIPYPFVRLQVLDLKLDGQIGDAVINGDTRIITVELADTVNLKKVRVNSISTTQNIPCELKEGQTVNLSKPFVVHLRLYNNAYDWTIVANQQINRSFKVANQVGSATFFPNERYATAMITEDTPLNYIRLQELKLAPEGATINGTTALPEVTWTRYGNFATATVNVNYKDIIVNEEWTLYVFQTEASVTTKAADGWVNVAWLYGEGKEGAENGFELKEDGTDQWIRVEASRITHQGGSFSACVPHLKAQTTYLCRAYSGEDYGNELSFTTGTAMELPGGAFDDWHKDPQKSKVWNPWAENGTQVWDSGNDGATTLGESISVPTTDTWDGNGQAAMLQSQFVGIGSIGKFAAGNLFIGQYVKTDGTNGVLSFGVPFSERPTKLKGHYRYKTAVINDIPNNSTPEDRERFLDYLGKPDTCAIYIALGDWNEPIEIRTRPSNRKLFDKNDPNVIAYAELNCGENVPEYQEFELELTYNATDRVPRYLLLVCSASKYGDFFTGGDGAVLHVDDFCFEYDYDE